MDEKKKQGVSLIKLLAVGSTDKLRALLDRYGAQSSGSYDDLAKSLSNLYLKTPDKVSLEKEIVSIHPHRDLILKYSNKPEKAERVEAIEDLQVMTKSPEAEIKEEKANCAGGCPMASQMKSNASGGDSTSDIVGKILESQKMQSNRQMFITVSVVAMAGVALYLGYKHMKRA